ncbi:S-adenosyl-L-methionine-dependent methyltransferase [Agrocybe pediades]|nr:S-adenosyl-L-methionine-dependent methyltransferase [Agrocybe pediades]
MATFAKSTFNASVYASSRPTYPIQLFEHIFAFHGRGTNHGAAAKPQWNRAVDVGCGTGQATTRLTPFKEVIGVDPSLGMLEKARKHVLESTGAGQTTNYRFVQGSAEDMKKAVPEDESVDLVVAGGLLDVASSAQAAHWFDWSKVWPETSRVLRPGGTAAFWIYAEFRLPQFPSLGPKITAYAQGTDPLTSLGPHFERPGRTVLERHLVDVPEPAQISKDICLEPLERVYFCGEDVPAFVQSAKAQIHPVIMRKEMCWRDLLAYFRTWSSLHTYHEKFPEDQKRDEDQRFLEADLRQLEEQIEPTASDAEKSEIRGGDISIRFWKDLREDALKASPGADVSANGKILVEWPLALLMTKKVHA